MPLTVTEISTQEAGRLSIMAGGLVQVPLSEIEMPQGQIEPSRAEATPPRCFVRRQGIIPTSLLGIDIPEPILSRSLALCGSHGLHKFCFGQGPVSEVNLGATVAQTSPGIIRSQLACSSIVSQRFVPPLLLHGKIPQPAVGTGVLRIERDDLSILSRGLRDLSEGEIHRPEVVVLRPIGGVQGNGLLVMHARLIAVPLLVGELCEAIVNGGIVRFQRY